ncbi:MAG: methyltransferase domain-containing protein [Archangiaceae bacterium]|nr:methyltransferase domain-containing protein [Archangiaceae bacterium]
MSTAEQVNREFYEQALPGQNDYWKKMAAPRFRVRTVLAELKARAPASVVDLGCGGGQLLDEVKRAVPGARLVGVDLSKPQLELNRQRDPDTRWVYANVDQPMKWADEDLERYDAVTVVEVIEHVDRPAQLLENARALLARGGFLVLSTQSGRVGETERRVGHRRHFTTSEIRGLLTGAGFRPERVWNAGFPFHDFSKWYANLNPDASMGRFGDKPYGLSEDLVCLGLRALFRLNSNRAGAQLFAVAKAD